MTKKTNNLGISFLHIINPVHIYQSKRPYAYKDEDTESTSMEHMTLPAFYLCHFQIS